MKLMLIGKQALKNLSTKNVAIKEGYLRNWDSARLEVLGHSPGGMIKIHVISGMDDSFVEFNELSEDFIKLNNVSIELKSVLPSCDEIGRDVDTCHIFDVDLNQDGFIDRVINVLSPSRNLLLRYIRLPDSDLYRVYKWSNYTKDWHFYKPYIKDFNSDGKPDIQWTNGIIHVGILQGLHNSFSQYPALLYRYDFTDMYRRFSRLIGGINTTDEVGYRARMTKSEWLQHEKRRVESELTKASYCRKIRIKPPHLSLLSKEIRLKISNR